MITALLLSASLTFGAIAAPMPTEPHVYVQALPSAQLAVLQVIVTAGTTRETRAQSGLAALSAETILHTKIDGTSLTDRIANAGGSISYSVSPHVVRFTIEALPNVVPALVRDLAAACAHPDVSPQTIATARTVLGRRIDQLEADPINVGVDMLSNSYYNAGAALPSYGSRANIAMLQPDDVAAFIASHYVRDNTFVTAVGDVDASLTDVAEAALNQLSTADDAGAPITSQPLRAPGTRVITERDIGVPIVLLGFEAPALGENDFATMLVLSAMLQDVGQRNAVALLSGAGPSISVIYRYDVQPAMLDVVFNGGLVNPSVAISAIDAATQRAAKQPLDDASLAHFRSQADGQWLLETSTLADRAWLLGTTVTNAAGVSSESIVAAIDHVTASDVQRAASTFLQHYTEAVVLPRSSAAPSRS